MVRLLGILAAFLCCIPTVTAVTAPTASRLEERQLEREAKKKSGETILRVATPSGTEEFAITAETEVVLDGRSCKLADVPGNAVIVSLEVSAGDDRTVVRILFRTKK